MEPGAAWWCQQAIVLEARAETDAQEEFLHCSSAWYLTLFYILTSLSSCPLPHPTAVSLLFGGTNTPSTMPSV